MSFAGELNNKSNNLLKPIQCEQCCWNCSHSAKISVFECSRVRVRARNRGWGSVIEWAQPTRHNKNTHRAREREKQRTRSCWLPHYLFRWHWWFKFQAFHKQYVWKHSTFMVIYAGSYHLSSTMDGENRIILNVGGVRYVELCAFFPLSRIYHSQWYDIYANVTQRASACVCMCVYVCVWNV